MELVKEKSLQDKREPYYLSLFSFFNYVIGSQVQELSTAANGYQRVVKENMNLYNMVQDLKGGSQV